MTERWRHISSEEREDMVARAAAQMHRRWIVDGPARHGYSLQGDPLRHAREEAVDNIFYIEAAQKERTAMQAEIDRLERENAELIRDLGALRDL